MLKLVQFIAALLLSGQLFAQSNTWSDADHALAVSKMEFKAKRVVPPAPEAAALGQFGNVPVSLFTGTPRISVPLDDLKGASLSVGVSLSYSASGFKPQDIPTWAGAGWTFSAGGVVTRSVMGNPDLIGNYYTGNNSWNLPSTDNLFANYNFMDSIQKGLKEVQPDVFYFNMNGKSGKFYIKPDLSVFKKEKDNIQISHSITANWNTSNLNKFVITDEQGVVYEFGEVEVSTMTLDDATTSVQQPMTYSYPSSWYLTKMTSPDGKETIEFTYYTTSQNHTLFQSYLGSGAVTTGIKIGTSGSVSPSSVFSLSPAVSVSRKYLQKISLKKNNAIVGYIDIVSVANARQDLSPGSFPDERLLQSVKSYSLNSLNTFTQTKQTDFFFSYFAVGAPYGDKRLRLDSLKEIPIGTGTVSKPAYVFEYNNSVPTPSFENASIDHWGYFNGTDGVSHLVPTVVVDGVSYGLGANREPSLYYTQTCILQKIKYPTGGYTTFEYELNEGKDQNTNIVKPVGGLRVKQIVDYSFNNTKATQKNYIYKLDDGTTSGQAYFPYYLSNTVYYFYAYPILNPPYDWTDYRIEYTTVAASSVAGLGSIQGSHIGYGQVTEFSSDVINGEPLGKTVYNYNIATLNAIDDNVANGDLLKQSVYNNAGKLLYEQSSSYEYTNLGGITSYKVSSAAVQDNKTQLCKYIENGNTFYQFKHLELANPSCLQSTIIKNKLYYSGSVVSYQGKKLLAVIEKKFDQVSNTYLTSSKTMSYDNAAHNLPTKLVQISSNNEQVVTETKYPLDYTIPPTGLDNPSAAIKNLQNLNIIGAEIESVQYRQNPDGSNRRYIAANLTIYESVLPVPKTFYRLQTTMPVSSFTMSSSNGTFSYNSNYGLLGGFRYDPFGNLGEQSKANDMIKSYVWDYGYSLPTAEVMNAELESIAYTSFETTGSGNFNVTGSIVSNKVAGGITGLYGLQMNSAITLYKSQLITTKQYLVSYWSKNGAITVTSNAGSSTLTTGWTKGAWTYYEHLLPLGSSTATLSATNAIIDELRLYPKDAQMSTTTYDLLNGEIVAQCGPNNSITYFEYDGYYRLVNIKDEDGNIVKNFKYNYGLGIALTAAPKTLFYNSQQQGTFYKQGCPSGSEAAATVYKVVYGTYVSSISQADADSKALADVNANGQAYANANGLCYYWNTVQSGYYSKNDCLPENGISVCSLSGPVSQRGRILFTIPAHTYSSLISLADANAQAATALASQGQAYANSVCWCSCGGVGQKMVNGTCETGTRINSSTMQLPNGTWQCTYYYQWSDGSVSQFYTETNSSPCPIY